jgi:glycosyltransferase involved in cell wall biosynthesis
VLLARGIGRRLVARVARGAELLTADSHHLLEVLRRSGASAERLRWVPWGVSASWASPALELSREQAAGRAGLPADRPIVLSQRGPAPLYRQDTFVRAMAELAEDSPDALGVVPALDRSPAGEHTARLRAQVRQLGLAGNVEIVEPWPHDEVAFAYRAAAACVSVPESDSAPTSVFEALAVGTPAIVSELPWVSEPVHREARLEVVPVGDHAALARAIAGALSGQLDGGIEPNRELVARSFDRDTVFAGMEREYERLSAGFERGRAAGARA